MTISEAEVEIFNQETDLRAIEAWRSSEVERGRIWTSLDDETMKPNRKRIQQNHRNPCGLNSRRLIWFVFVATVCLCELQVPL